MATVTFTGPDPVAEARALATTLALWLREQPPPEQTPAATVKFSYSDDGHLATVVVTLEG
ncbi:hypothetical protein D3C77_621090 [compost metagenome]